MQTIIKNKLLATLLFCLIGIFSYTFAQAHKTDSLKTVLKKAVDDTSRVNALNELIQENVDSRNYTEADSLIEIALKIAHKAGFKSGLGTTYKYIGFIQERKTNLDDAIKNYQQSLSMWQEVGDKQSIANGYRYLGAANFKKGNYFDGLKYLQLSLDLSKEINYRDGIAHTSNSIGNIHNRQGNYSEALKYYLNAFTIFKESNDKRSIAGALNNIGNVYKNQKDYSKALKNHEEALKIRKEINDRQDIAASYNNIGSIYFNQKNYNKAMENYMAALEIKKQLDSKRDIAISMANIGITFNQLDDPENALNYTAEALKLYKQAGDRNGIAETFINFGEIHLKTLKYKNAQMYLDSAIAIAKEIGAIGSLKESYMLKSTIDSLTGNHLSALNNFKQGIRYRDSLFNEDNLKKIVQAEMNFNFEKIQTEEKLKQEQKDALREQEIKKQRILVYSFSVGLVLMLLLVITIYRNNKQKQRTNRELQTKNELIRTQKQEVEFQKKLVEEKNNSITDSINYAKHIQSSFLTSEKYISQYIPEYFILFKPKDIVSGDFYWVMERNDDIYVCTADCTGHGIPGAFMSLIGMGVLNEIIHSKSHLIHTNEILNELRRIIILAVNSDSTIYEGQDGMDAVLYRFNRRKMELEYSAANNPFYIIRENTLLEFKPDKMPIGKYLGLEKPFNRHTITLQKGDRIYTFSDGYADQFGGEQGKKLKSKKLKELLLKHNQKPMIEQKNALNEAITNWQGSFEQVDDITIVGIMV